MQRSKEMKKVNKLKVLTVILMGVLIVCSAKMSFAATAISTISSSSGNSTNNAAVNNISNENNTVQNESNTVTNEDNAVTTNNIVTNNVVNNTTLPDTGAKSSTAIIFLIVLTSISAIYTYKKVKEYNI
jgi:LPXTG-motif cell wall-anchored protein